MESKGETLLLGVQRESLLNNPLLTKSELGKPLRRCFILPPEGFTYGKPSIGTDCGAAEALSQWNGTKSKTLSLEKRGKRDFIGLNKAATQSGLVTAQEHAQYRATHDVQQKPSMFDTGLKPLKGTTQTIVYGVPTRPSTPVFDLLEHKYQERWLQERKQQEATKRVKDEQRKRAASGKVYMETRASLLRRHSPPVDPPPLWQMSRFQKVPPVLHTFRGQMARERAFSHHTTDCTSRTGVFGHGIYEGAKS